MATSSYDSAWNLLPLRFYVGVGATVAVFFTPLPGQVSSSIKYMNGGTLEILPASLGISFAPGTSTVNGTFFSSGSTQSAQALANLSGTGYLMGTTEVFTIAGPAPFYLSATGATTLVSTVRSFSQGN